MTFIQAKTIIKMSDMGFKPISLEEDDVPFEDLPIGGSCFMEKLGQKIEITPAGKIIELPKEGKSENP